MRAIDNAAFPDAREPIRTAIRPELTDTLSLPIYPVGTKVWMADLASVRELVIASERRDKPEHVLPFVLGPEESHRAAYLVVDKEMISPPVLAVTLFATEALAEWGRRVIGGFVEDCETYKIWDAGMAFRRVTTWQIAAPHLQWLMAQPIGSYPDWLVIHARLWAAIRLDERAHLALDSSKASGGAA